MEIRKNKRFILFVFLPILFLGVTFAVASLTGIININIGTATLGVNYNAEVNSNSVELYPILDSEVSTNTTNVLRIEFAVNGLETNNANKPLVYDIALVNLEVDCELLSPYVKWRLTKNTNEEVFEGSLSYTFDTIVNGRLVLTSIQQDLPSYNDTPDSYVFELWISDSCQANSISNCLNAVDQTYLLNKLFKGEIEVELYTSSNEYKQELVRNPSVQLDSSTCIMNFADSLVSKANDATITSYTSGDTAEMYTFNHGVTFQMAELSDYRFIGNAPDNYVYYNCVNPDDTSTCELWRVVGVFPTENGSDNVKVENRVKLVSVEPISATIDSGTQSTFSWDSSTGGTNGATNDYGINQWGATTLSDGTTKYVGADLMRLLNEGAYYNRTEGICYINDGDISTPCSFSETGLTASAKLVIGNAKYYSGAVLEETDNFGDGEEIYFDERGITLSPETDVVRTYSWVGKVGLIYPSDFVYTYGYGVNDACFNDAFTCSSTSSWLVHDYQWFFNPYFMENSDSNSPNSVFAGRPNGKIYPTSAYSSYSVYPTVYLNADIRLKSGNGSIDNPYQLVYSTVTQAEDTTNNNASSKVASIYLVNRANDSSITNYSDGVTTEMYTFSQNPGSQQSSWSSEQMMDYRYIGSNPNNYVYYNCTDTSTQNSTNCEVWRILGVFSVENVEGNIERRVKLILNTGLSDANGQNYFAWDSSASGTNSGQGINQWGATTLTDGTTAYAGADLMQLLNSGAYYNRGSGTCYINEDEASTTCDFSSNGLTDSAKTIIGDARYYLGGFTVTNNWLSYTLSSIVGSSFYTMERNTAVYSGSDVNRTTYWDGKVGIMYPSDFIYSYAYNVDSICYTNPINCTTDDGGVPTSSWIFNTNDWGGNGTVGLQWFLNPGSNFANVATAVYGTGEVSAGKIAYSTQVGARPVVYLNSDIEIIAGDGSINNPYKLSY